MRLSTLDRLADTYGMEVCELLAPKLLVTKLKPVKTAPKKQNKE